MGGFARHAEAQVCMWRAEKTQRDNRGVKRLCVSYLVSPMLLQLLVELQGDAHHHFGLVPVGVGDVVQDAIKICGTEDDQVTNETQAKAFLFFFLLLLEL